MIQPPVPWAVTDMVQVAKQKLSLDREPTAENFAAANLLLTATVLKNQTKGKLDLLG